MTPTTYRKVTAVAVVALVFIIVTGGAVRLTGSGLGCSTWPNCEPGSFTPVDATDTHGMVEFVNRLITGLVSASVALATLGALKRRPYRRDLVVLALGLVVGVLAQVVLGGVTVLTHLTPPAVMAHFLLSLVLVTNAVVLHHRAGRPGTAPVPVLAGVDRLLARLLLVVLAAAIFAGTVVTGTGPHGGDEDVVRLGFDIEHVSRIHSLSVIAFVALLIAVLARLGARDDVPAQLRRAGQELLLIAVGQAAIGYAQYLTGVPVVLVGIHILGASLVWAAAVRFLLATSVRPEEGAGPPAGAGDRPGSSAAATPTTEHQPAGQA